MRIPFGCLLGLLALPLCDHRALSQEASTKPTQIEARIQGNAMPADAAKWFRLARYYEADRQFDEAAKAIAKALELSPNSIPALAAAAKIDEQRDNLKAAIETNTKLASVDRRYRTEYLKKVAQLETRLGRRDRALAAGRDVIASAPGNPEAYEFFAQMCFQLGAADEGLETLRRSVRVNPSDPRGLTTLANALAEQFRTDEAIELFWRAFEKGEDTDAKLTVVQRLAELYLQTNAFDKLTDRLERLRRDSKEPRELTICLAQAYQSAGDDGTARQELEKLLTADTRDTMLLQQLVKLCESGDEIDEALKYQQQLLKVAPGRDGEMRLAQLLARAGDSEQASAILSRLTSEERDPEQVLKSLDTLLGHGKRDEVVAITSRLLRDQPKNWELLYREGHALAEEKPDDAAKRFAQLLTLNIPDDEPDTATRERKKREASGKGKKPTANAQPQMPASYMRMQMSYQIRHAVGLQAENYYGGGQQQTWMPTDFGQARMAAEAWLLSIAEKKSAGEEYLGKRREAWQAKKDDSRAAWDWYYLQIIRMNGPDLYEATKSLSLARNATNESKTLFLQSLASRGSQQTQIYEDPSEAAKKELPPLPDDELKHMLACYEATRGGADSQSIYFWGQSSMHTVMLELRRAKREAEAKKLYDDAIAAVTAPEQAAMLLMVVMQEQDVDAMLKLMAVVFPDDVANSTKPNAQSILSYLQSRDYHAMMLQMLMAGKAQKKELAEQHKMFEKFLGTTMREHAKTAASGKKKPPSQGMYGNSNYYQVFTGLNWNNARGEQVDFPTPNEFYDHATLQLLRQMFSNHKEADQLADLRKFFDERIRTATVRERPAAGDAKPTDGPLPNGRGTDGTTTADAVKTNDLLFWSLGLAYLEWWSEHRDEAVAALGKAAEAMPDSLEMRLELATLLEREADNEGAFALVNTLQPLDHQMLQKVETMALRLSVNTGNLDRARLAAERLFGLRLDANLQVQLAQQMFQLGMTEMAEAVMSRASRQAGNKTAVLISLMQQYSSQNKPEVAAQIAYQLLRRTPKSSSQSRMYGGQTSEDQARKQALVVLNRTGRLPEMIGKLEAQLAKAPESVRLIETLGEYYTASNQQAKATELFKRLAGKKTNDPVAEFELAIKLVQAGDAKIAAEKLETVLKKQPQLIANRWHEVEQAFRSANKQDDLYAAVEKMDLKLFRQNPYLIGNLLQYMFQDEKQKDRGIRIFKKAWDAMPDQAPQFMQYVSHVDAIWKMPDIYEYLRKSLIPADTVALTDLWRGANSNTTSYSGEGRIETMATRTLKMAKDQKRLPKLAEEVEASLGKHKNWHGGKVLLALVHAKLGKHAEAKESLAKLVEEQKKTMPTQVSWVIGQEIDDIPELRPVAIELLEAAVAKPDEDSGNGFEYGPGRRLVHLYSQAGEKGKARDLLLKNAHPKPNPNYGSNPDYMAYRQINQISGVARQLHTLGFDIDAIKLYREIQPGSELMQKAGQYRNNFDDQTKQGLAAALASLKPESLAELLTAGVKNGDGKIESAVDLLLLVEPMELDKARLQSLIVNLLETAARDKKPAHAECLKILADKQQQQPDDLTLTMLTILGNAERKKLEGAAAKPATSPTPSPRRSQPTIPTSQTRVVITPQFIEQVQALAKRVAAAGAVAANGDAGKSEISNSKSQISDSKSEILNLKSEIALWLIARECFVDAQLAEAGNVLGERALAAARKQPANEQTETLAILREWGQLALDGGDAKLAERRWTEMVEVVLPAIGKKEGEKKLDADKSVKVEDKDAKKPADGKDAKTPAKSSGLLSNALSSVFGLSPAKGRGAAAAKPNMSPIPTPGQFEQIAQIARLAAQNGMTDLSLRAVRETLRHGPPMDRINAEQFGQQPQGFGITPQDDHRLLESSRQVEEKLAELEQLWRQKGLTDEVLFDTLLAIVMPEARPNEMFLYPRPLAYLGNGQVRSLSLLLAKAAAAGGKSAVLRERLEAKAAQVPTEIAARVALAHLAAAERDSDRTQEQLVKLQALLLKSTLTTTNELAAHAALPATQLPKLPAAAVPLLEGIVAHAISQTQNSNEEPARSLTFRLAKHFFQQKQPDAAKKHLDNFVTFLGPVYARYGGDYGQYRKREALLQIAGLYAEHRRTAEAFDLLGQYADMPAMRNYGGSNASATAKLIYSSFSGLSADERYSLLKKWALPVEGRQSVRSIASVVAERGARFQRAQLDPKDGHVGNVPHADPALTPNHVPVSTLSMLVDAAKEAGKLDELRDLVQPANEKNVENAKPLWHLIQVARGDVATLAPELSKFASERQANANKVDGNNRTDTDDLLFARAIRQTPELYSASVAFGNSALTQSQRFVHQPGIAQARRELAIARASRIPNANLVPAADPGLKHWISGSLIDAAHLQQGTTTPWWMLHDGILYHNSGADQDELFFAYPLIGEFEFSFDVFMGSWGEGNMGYGGLIVEAFNGGQPTYIHSAGEGEAITVHDPLDKFQEFNRYTLRVNGRKAEYIVNGHLVFTDDDAAQHNPFVALTAWGAWNSTFRNVRITGEPTIPREVPLISGDRMDGWVTSFYSETQPPRISVGKPDRYGREITTTRDPNPDAYDWATVGDELLGRRMPGGIAGSDLQPSRAYYNRPLRNGETVRFEFFHDADRQVHPTLGRLAMLMDKEGVKLLHLGVSRTDQFTGQQEFDAIGEDDGTGDSAASYFLNAKPFRRGPQALPLKSNDWNAASLSLDNGVAKLTLNGELVFERPFPATHDLHFGFYHDKATTSAKVRNVVLSGNWPTSLTPEVRGDLLARRGDVPPPATRQAMSVVMGELMQQKLTREVLREARAMPAAQRYEFLANWVIPGDDHLSWRLFGHFTTNSAAPNGTRFVSGTALAAGNSPGIVDPESPVASAIPLRVSVSELTPHRSPEFGLFEAPIFELLAVAKELNKSKELEERLLNASQVTVGDVHPSYDARSRMAIAVLVELQNGNADKAKAALLELNRLGSDDPAGLPEIQRWAEFVAVVGAFSEPSLWSVAEVIATRLVDHSAAAHQGVPWETQVHWLRQEVRSLMAHTALSSTALAAGSAHVTRPAASAVPLRNDAIALKQWHPHSALTAAERVNGPSSRWELVGRDVTHQPGASNGWLTFASPLRGSFTVDAEVTAQGHRELMLMYSGQWARNMGSPTVFETGTFTALHGGQSLPAPIPNVGAYMQARLVVEPTRVTAFLNGQKIHERELAEDHDPWLAIYSLGRFSGVARNVRISGTPIIPTEIDLTAGTDLASWLDVFIRNPNVTERQPDGNTKNLPYWEKQGGEIFGRKLNDTFAGSNTQSVLQYHRPMVEDGEIEYEFFYRAGQSLVHPTLDRLTFLLQPDGVAIHGITDGQYETSGLQPDNVEETNPKRERGRTASTATKTAESTAEKSERTGASALAGASGYMLKENDWNRVKLSLKGDVVTLSLNGAAVYERTLEASNQRNFGLFRFADQTEARVRKIVYRGEWPKTLPKIEEQELADRPSHFEFTDTELPHKLHWNFRGDRPKWLRPTFDQAKLGKFAKATDEGLLLSLPAGREPMFDQLGMEATPILRGDFEAIVAYQIRDLKLVTLVEGWKTPGIDLSVRLNSGMEERVFVERRLLPEKNGGHTAHSVRAFAVIPGKFVYPARLLPWTAMSGRTKITRRGNVATTFVAAENSNDWVRVEQHVVSPSEVPSVSINARSFYPDSAAEILLTDFSIRAAKIMTDADLRLENAPRANFRDDELTVRKIWDFKTTPLKDLKSIGQPFTNSQAFESTELGLRAKMLVDREFNGEYVGLDFTDHFGGDFEVTGKFTGLKTLRGPQSTQWRVPGVDMEVQLDKPGAEMLRLERREFEPIGDVQGVNTVQSETAADGKLAWHTLRVGWSATGGRLRIARKGNTVYFLAAPDDTENWELIRERPVSSGNILRMTFGARNFFPDSTADVVLQELSIRAERAEK